MPKNNGKERKEWRRKGARLRKTKFDLAMEYVNFDTNIMNVDGLMADSRYAELNLEMDKYRLVDAKP